MVEYRRASLDATYHAISHPTRREMLKKLSAGDARVSDLAAPHGISFAAVSKHIKVLEDAGLVKRSVQGREHWLRLEPSRLQSAAHWLDDYRSFWESRLDRLESRLKARPR